MYNTTKEKVKVVQNRQFAMFCFKTFSDNHVTTLLSSAYVDKRSVLFSLL